MEDREESRARMTNIGKPPATPLKAAALVEYALILSLVSVLVVGSLALVGGQTGTVFTSVAGALGGPQNNGCQGGGPACAGNNGNGQGNGNGNGQGQGDENGNAGRGNPGGGQGSGSGNGGGNGGGE